MNDKQDINWGAISGFIAFVLFISTFYILYTAKYPSVNQFYANYFVGDPQGSIFETFFAILSSLVISGVISALFFLFLLCAVETFKAIGIGIQGIGIQKLQDKINRYENKKNKKTDKGSPTTERNR